MRWVDGARKNLFIIYGPRVGDVSGTVCVLLVCVEAGGLKEGVECIGVIWQAVWGAASGAHGGPVACNVLQALPNLESAVQ